MTETTTAAEPAQGGVWAFLRATRSPKAPPGVGRARPMHRALALLLLILIPVVGIFAVTTAAHADDDDENSMKFSFYNAASSTTAFFSTIQDPSSKTSFKQPWLDVMKDPGSAGGLLGYADPEISLSTGWLASKLSGSSDSIGYETLLVREESDDGGSYSASATYRGMVDYAYFGAALNGLGLDSTSTGLSLGFMNMVTGGVILVLYVLSGLVDTLFSAFIGMLSMLNPFKLFYVGVSQIDEARGTNYAVGMVGGGSGGTGPLSGLADFIGGWYATLNSLSWGVMVPVFVATLLFSLVMLKKDQRGGLIRKFLIRLTFIGIGLPLLGTMYTGVLNSMAEASVDGNSGSTRVVMSTYVDFEKWAKDYRLEVPAGAVIEWKQGGSGPTDLAAASVRTTALQINNKVNNLRMSTAVSANQFDASWSEQIMDGMTGSSPANDYSKTVGMLTRYMLNDQYSAANYETAMKGALTQSTYYTSEDNSERVVNWFDSLQKKAEDMNDLSEDGGDKLSPTLNPVVSVQTNTGLQAGPAVRGDGRAFRSDSVQCSGALGVSTGDGTPRPCNLSPLAMYNYLNTDFGATSMTMYSSTKAMSEATRSIHNSVNQVGTGAMGFLYWVNAAVLLGAFVLIGLGYAFSMLFANIRRSLQIITAVPFATLGAMAAIAKVIVYTVALVLEVILTIFVYKLVQEILISLPQLVEKPFSVVLSANNDNAVAGFIRFLVEGWAFQLVVTLLSTISVVIFTILALRIRKSFVKAIEEAVTKLVEKFTGSGATMPGGGALPALVGGAAAGAGQAATARMINGSSPRGPQATPLPGGDGKGPAAITTAGGTTGTGAQSAGGTKNVQEVTGGATMQIEGGPGAGGPAGGPNGSNDGGPRSGDDDDNPPPPGGGGGTMAAMWSNGDPGNGVDGTGEVDGSTAGTEAAREVELGKKVESQGLSQPSAPTAGDDAMSGVSDSMENTMDTYKEADKKRVSGAKDGLQAGGHAAAAVGQGMAGDEAGALESGGKALEKGGSAAAANAEAKQMSDNAGRTPTEGAASTRGQAQAQKGRQVSELGGQVAGAAGAAKGTSGSPSAPASPSKGGPKAPAAPRRSPSRPPAPARAPSAPAAPRQQGPSSAPARPAPAPAQARPAQSAPSAPSAPAQRSAPQAPSRPAQAPAAPRGPQAQRAPSAPSAPRAPAAPSGPNPARGPRATPGGDMR